MAESAVLSRKTGEGDQGRLGVCPFLTRVVALSTSSIQAYCQGYRYGRLRTPDAAMFRRFCSTGRYRTCPIYLSRIR